MTDVDGDNRVVQIFEAAPPPIVGFIDGDIHGAPDDPCEVDEVDVFVAVLDRLQQDAFRPGEHADVAQLRTFGQELDLETCFFAHFSYGGLTGKLVGVDMTSGRKPLPYLPVEDEERSASLDDEGRRREIACGVWHSTPGMWWFGLKEYGMLLPVEI